MSVSFGDGAAPTPVCTAGEAHSGRVESFSAAAVSFWHLRYIRYIRGDIEGRANIECLLWCSGNGTAFETGSLVTGPIDSDALMAVVSQKGNA